jgi:hypothetical protein
LGLGGEDGIVTEIIGELPDTMDNTADSASDGTTVSRIDQEQLAQDIVEQARAQGLELVGPGGLLTGLTKRVLETALKAEMSEHLGYGKHDVAGRNRGNSGNGTRAKTVLTGLGPVEVEVPLDRQGTGTARSSRSSCASGSAGWTRSTRSCSR